LFKTHHKTLPALAVLASLSVSAPAQTTGRADYQLPAAPLERTLLAIAADSGVTVAYDPGLLEGARAAPVVGRYSAAEAIARALEGSGFELAARPGGALIVRRVPAKPVPALPLKHTGLVLPARAAPPAAPAPAPADAPAGIATVTVSGSRHASPDAVDDDPRRVSSAQSSPGAPMWAWWRWNPNIRHWNSCPIERTSSSCWHPWDIGLQMDRA
jgi:iron complex outermembrane receptor protein